MKTILITLLAIVTCAQGAGLVTHSFLGPTNAQFNLRINKANETNAAQTAAIAAANATNAANIVLANTLSNRVVQAEATNATQTASVAAKQAGSFTLSNFVAYLVANGVTNITAGSNAVLYVNNGTLIINGTPSIVTNGLPVFQTTNLIAETINADTFNVGVLIPTNTVYITVTNAAVSQSTNYVADFLRSEQTIQVAGAVHLAHATNLWAGATNAYLFITLHNFSGSDQTLSIPAAWRRALNFPTVLTNRTVVQLNLKNYGGLSQTNILSGFDQY